MEKDIDYTIGLLKRINSIEIGGVLIYKFFQIVEQRTSFSPWSAQQQFLFGEASAFSVTKDFNTFSREKGKNKIYSYAVDFFLYIIAFLISTTALFILLVSRTRVLTYSSDRLKKGTRNDPRMMAVYNELDHLGVSYAEAVHTMLGREFLYNVLKRLRPVMYLECLDLFLVPFAKILSWRKYKKLRRSISLHEFAESELPFVEYILKKYSYRCAVSVLKVSVLTAVLKASGLKVFLSIDDIRHSNELVEAARVANIHSCVFQHSNFDYFYGLDTLPPESYAFADVFYVWNDYWMKRIVELSPLFAFHKDRLHIGGRANGYTAGKFIKRSANRTSNNSIQVLVPYEVNVNKKELLSYIKKIMACGNTRVIFKGRPDILLSVQAGQYFLGPYVKSGKVELKVSMNDEDLSKVDIIVGVYTTLLDEMIEKGIPVGVFKTSYPLYNNLAESNLAEDIDVAGKDICKQLEKIRQLPVEVLRKRREIFTQKTGDIRKTVRKIAHPLGR